MRSKERWFGRLYMLLVIIVLVSFLFPFVWMILGSFKNQAQIMSTQNLFWFTPTFNNYISVFAEHDFVRFMFNSFIVGLVSTFFALVLGLPASYSIAKYKQNQIGLMILVARIIPGISFMIPWFILFSQVGLVDTYTSLILAHMLVGLPFIIWIMISFFEGLPNELEEAARVDGCTIQSAFVRIMLPLAMPGVITSSILAFIFSWNNFMFSLVLSGERTRTLPIAVFNFMSYSEINWGGLMAAAVIITMPIVVIALILQRYIITGITAGAVKG